MGNPYLVYYESLSGGIWKSSFRLFDTKESAHSFLEYKGYYLYDEYKLDNVSRWAHMGRRSLSEGFWVVREMPITSFEEFRINNTSYNEEGIRV